MPQNNLVKCEKFLFPAASVAAFNTDDLFLIIRDPVTGLFTNRVLRRYLVTAYLTLTEH